jgi:hypothetical protein
MLSPSLLFEQRWIMATGTIRDLSSCPLHHGRIFRRPRTLHFLNMPSHSLSSISTGVGIRDGVRTGAQPQTDNDQKNNTPTHGQYLPSRRMTRKHDKNGFWRSVNRKTNRQILTFLPILKKRQ